MHVGEISQPIRTRLGFHIVEVTDFKPARQMSFEEVQPEIRFAIKNEKRRAALQSFDCGSLARSETCTATLALSGIRKLLRCLLAFLPAA
jgi:hypothetical protein